MPGIKIFSENWFRGSPLKALSLVLIVVVVSVVAVHAYFRLLSPQAGPRVSITSPPLEFSMELGMAEYQHGENITITFLLRNIGNETINVTKSSRWLIYPDLFAIPMEAKGATPQHVVSGLFHFGFSIAHQNGTEIFKQSSGDLQATYDFFIEPEGYIKQTWIWVNLWEGSPVIDTLPRGTYQIRGIFYGAVVPGFAVSTLETPSITFMIK